MKLSQTRLVLLILVLALPPALSGCGLVNRIRARNALNEGAKAFKEGRFAEAEEKYKLAYSLDPEQKSTPYLIARAIHGQYRPGVNNDKAEEAVTAYEAVLSSPDINQKAKDEASAAILMILDSLNQPKRMDDWLEKRAKDENVAPDKRAEAYILLASKQAKCSNDFTEANRKEENRVIVYTMPENQAGFKEAADCVGKGMDYIKPALDLNDRNIAAWKVKRDLLLEKLKLAQMEKKTPQELAPIESEAKDAHARFEELDAEAKQKQAEEEAKKEKKA